MPKQHRSLFCRASLFLLALYPASFRDKYRRPMEGLLSDIQRDMEGLSRKEASSLAAHALADLFLRLLAEHLSNLTHRLMKAPASLRRLMLTRVGPPSGLTVSQKAGFLMVETYLLALAQRAFEIADRGEGYGPSELTGLPVPVAGVVSADAVNVVLCLGLIFLGMRLVQGRGRWEGPAIAGILAAKAVAELADYSVRGYTNAHFLEIGILSFMLPLTVIFLLAMGRRAGQSATIEPSNFLSS